jgi:hypothetical protein
MISINEVLSLNILNFAKKQFEQIVSGPFFRIPHIKFGIMVNFQSKQTLPGKNFGVQR